MSTHEIDLVYRPRVWQERIHHCTKRFIIIIAHRRSGKTVASRMELIHRALEKPGFEGAYIAPFLSQGRRVMWNNIKELSIKIPGTEVRETEMLITFPNRSTIRCLGADSADGIRGLGFDYVVGDEFADWDPSVLPQVVFPTLAGRNGSLTLIGTPKGIDPLSELFERNKENEDWECFKFTVLDTGVFSDSELAIMKSAMLPQQFALEFMCDYQQGTPNTLLAGYEIDEAFNRKIPDYERASHPIVLGVDVARYGDDRTVIFRRQGPVAFDPIIMRKCSTIEIANAIADEYHKHNVDAIFIDYSGGLGGGVQDQLQARGIDPIMVHFNGKPQSDRFRNTRAEMWFRMCQWIRGLGVLPRLPGMKTEITSTTYKDGDDHKMQLDSKADLKKRGMESPDLSDALALTFYCTVSPKAVQLRKTQNVTDWDPFADA